MKHLSANQELDLFSQGYENIFGIDEAGRGSWAGPVVAACVAFDKNIDVSDFSVIDSKMLSVAMREKVFSWLVKNFDYGVGIVSNQVIDDIGILPATKLAMKQAVDSISNRADYILIDAVDLSSEIEVSQSSIIKGDQKVWTIAAASIVAKVVRDKIMINYHNQDNSNYFFDEHKGYGTKKHLECLKKYGICPIHRRSYKPVAKFCSN